MFCRYACKLKLYMPMNKNFTHSLQNAQKISQILTVNLELRIRFLKDYSRAYTCLKTSSLSNLDVFLN